MLFLPQVGKEDPKNWDIPEVLPLITKTSEENKKKLGYSTSYMGKFIKTTNFCTIFTNIWDFLHSFHKIIQIY